MLGEPTSEMVCNARVEDAGFSREHIHVENPVCARLYESGVYDSGKGKEQRNSSVNVLGVPKTCRSAWSLKRPGRKSKAEGVHFGFFVGVVFAGIAEAVVETAGLFC
jgi:hypothetical protein